MFKLIFLLVCLFAGAASAAQGGYLQQLQMRATQQKLAQTREWHALLHYEKNWLRSGLHSTVATPWFFRSDQGSTNPEAELRATLAAFMRPEKITPRKTQAQCLYPARYMFLNKHLHFDAKRMPVQACPPYQRWLAGLAPKSVSLVFPSAYLNSPASMFGHTLLRVDGKRRSRGTELLAYAINFAANTSDQKGLSFAYKGLTGGYPGVYGVFPYYEKVKQYAWIENRNVWAYKLKLSDAEVNRLLAHLWEMRGVHFDYYFLTKNCAYQLLALLQAARPSLHLVEQFSWYAIPADTIRALRHVPGLLGPAHFRPALRTILDHEFASLTPPQRKLALAVGKGKLASDTAALAQLSERDRARVLEVANDYLYYNFERGRFKRDQALPRSRAILLARSHIPVSGVFTPVVAPATAPDEGHPTLRLSATGVFEDGKFSLGFRVRPAYHDLLDAPGGYTNGAQINFFDLGLRLDPSSGDLRIDDLTLLNIVSLSPRSDLFKPISWRFGTGVRRRPASTVFGHEPNNLGFFAQGGPGLTWGSFEHIAAYTFALGSADANSSFVPAYALGVGASAGVLARPLRNWQVRAEVGGLNYAAGGHGHRNWAFVEQQFPLTGHWALRMRAEYEDAAGNKIGRGVLTLNRYF